MTTPFTYPGKSGLASHWTLLLHAEEKAPTLYHRPGWTDPEGTHVGELAPTHSPKMGDPGSWTDLLGYYTGPQLGLH